MAVSGGMKCVKFLVFIFNFLFCIAGIALIALGIYVQITLNKSLVIQNASSSGAPIVLIVVGAAIFLVSFFGCCGAWKENYCMVTTFAVLLALIFLVEVAAAIAAYIFRGKVQGIFDDAYRESMTKYSTDKELRDAIDSLQQTFKCCGANTTSDWSKVPPFNGTNNLPDSCCVKEEKGCGENQATTPSDNIFKEGCLPHLKDLFDHNLKIIAGVAVGIAAFELLGVIFACCLMKGIRSGYEVM